MHEYGIIFGGNELYENDPWNYWGFLQTTMSKSHGGLCQFYHNLSSMIQGASSFAASPYLPIILLLFSNSWSLIQFEDISP